MATTRHWTINSSNDEHGTLNGPEEMHVLVGRRLQSMETKLAGMLDEFEGRHREALGATQDAHHAEVESFKAIHANELALIRDLSRQAFSELNGSVGAAKISLAETIENTRASLTERSNAAQDAVLAALADIELKRCRALTETRADYEERISLAHRKYQNEAKELCAAHDREARDLNQRIARLERDLADKQLEVLERNKSLKTWTLVSLATLFMTAVATAGVFYR